MDGANAYKWKGIYGLAEKQGKTEGKISEEKIVEFSNLEYHFISLEPFCGIIFFGCFFYQC
jgi:hypothetical protein